MTSTTGILLAIGSRGDIEPILSIATTLLLSKTLSKIHLFMASDYTPLLPDPSTLPTNSPLTFHNSPTLTMQAFHAAIAAANATAVQNDTVRSQLNAIGAVTDVCVTPLLHEVVDLCRGELSEGGKVVVLGTTLASLVVATVADFCRVAAVVVHMQPNTPTRTFPCYLSGTQNALQAAAILAATNATHPTKSTDAPCNEHSRGDTRVDEDGNMASYDIFIDAMFIPAIPRLNDIRHKQYALPPMRRADVADVLHGRREAVHMVQTYPLGLVPRPRDISPAILVADPVADDYTRPGWSARTYCPKLLHHIEGGGGGSGGGFEGIVVTLGSMSVGEKEIASVSYRLFEGLRQGVGEMKVIVLTGSGKATPLPKLVPHDNEHTDLRAWCKRNVYVCTEDVQLTWLLNPPTHKTQPPSLPTNPTNTHQQTSSPRRPLALLCHGGAGSVAVGVWAGVPVVVAPLMYDQFFWGELLQRKGLGAVVSPGLTGCSVTGLREAVRRVGEKGVREAAWELGVRRRERRGGREAVLDLVRETLLP